VTVNIENALKIQGFTNENELRWLAEQASTRKTVVEIGAWKGRSTRAMADNLPEGGVIYAVDTWNGTPEDPHFKELVGKPEDWLFNQFAANIGEDLLHREKVENGVRTAVTYTVRPLREPSLTAARYLGGGCYDIKFDMIFIDAAHDYKAVKDDILAWLPLLAPGGLFCGHDFFPGRGGVIQAVTECFPKARKAGAGTIWVTE
jgi:predicted O-methyltransferase YrrM